MEPIRVVVDLYVPNDHEVVGQKKIYGAKLEFYVRPMLGERIRIDPTFPDETEERLHGLFYAIVTNIEHMPMNIAEDDNVLHADAELVEIDSDDTSAIVRIQQLLDDSHIWTCHSIS